MVTHPQSPTNKATDIAHVYLIVYYDNAKCNIELYGIFDQELEEEKLIKNISNESIYGKEGKIISNTNITSTNGEGFIVIHNLRTKHRKPHYELLFFCLL